MNTKQIDAAAKAIAQCMDYPWEHMPEQGRATMRKHAQAVLTAGLGSINEAVATINGEPATAHSLLAALIDIHDDEQKNAPEGRCYVESAWGDCMRIARAFLASAITPEPSLKERADALMAAGHAFWQACRRDAGGGAVRWLKATDGTTIIFTRGEYAGTLLSAIGADYQAPETVFEQPVGDDDMGGIVASIAAPAAIDAREQESWLTPTTHLKRFGDAMALLCKGKRPSDEILLAWLDRDADDLRLQEFACEHGPAWAQGIGMIDAAQVMAEQPTEGVDHEFLTPSEALSPATVVQPVFFASPEQANALEDRPGDNERGRYLPVRKTASGKFTMPLYAAQPCASQGCGGVETLHAVMKGVEEMLVKAYEHWDADREMKVGKILLALTGENVGYDKRSDAWRAVLAQVDQPKENL